MFSPSQSLLNSANMDEIYILTEKIDQEIQDISTKYKVEKILSPSEIEIFSVKDVQTNEKFLVTNDFKNCFRCSKINPVTKFCDHMIAVKIKHLEENYMNSNKSNQEIVKYISDFLKQ